MKTNELIYRLEKITSIANMTVDELNERQQTDRDELIKYLYPIKFGLMLGELRVLINELKKECD